MRIARQNVFSAVPNSWRHHSDLSFYIQYIGKFFDKIIYHGFTLNLEKCRFLKTSIQILGHTVSRKDVSPMPYYVTQVADFQNFRVAKDVQAWLGVSGSTAGT